MSNEKLGILRFLAWQKLGGQAYFDRISASRGLREKDDFVLLTGRYNIPISVLSIADPHSSNARPAVL